MPYICNCDGGLTETQIHEFFQKASRDSETVKRPSHVKIAIKSDQSNISFCTSSGKDKTNGCLAQILEIQTNHYPETLPIQNQTGKDHIDCSENNNGSSHDPRSDQSIPIVVIGITPETTHDFSQKLSGQKRVFP